MLLYRLLRPATFTEVAVGSDGSIVKYGFVRAKSCSVRLTVGSSWICVVETCDSDPVWFGLMIGSDCAVTVIASDTAAMDSVSERFVVSPMRTSTFSAVVGLNPSSVAVTRYGPPTRALGML